jgi:tetratricopeptide (TPR) repeat protein
MPARQSDPRFSRKSITRALKCWHQLEKLGQHPLAQLRSVESQRKRDGLPNNLRGRGLALQRVLQERIETFTADRTAGLSPDEPEPIHQRWQAYAILVGAFVEGKSRDCLADDLGISQRQYFRRQRAAIDALADRLWALERRHGAIVPTAPGDIPRIPHFIGRADELAYYRARLNRDHLTVITGMAGTGKTALAAELAIEKLRDGPVLWLTFRQGINTDVDTALQDIAIFLRDLGQGAYWDFLRAEAEAGERYPLNRKINHLISVLQASRCTICVDNYELVNHDADLTALFQILREKVSHSGSVDLIVMSRERPNFATGLDIRPLAGMTEDDARHLLADRGLDLLPPILFERVYRISEGNPVFLHLFSAWVVENGLSGFDTRQEVAQVAALVDGMWREPNIEQYLLLQVSQSLTPDERHLLPLIAAFRQAFDVHHQAIVELFAAAGVQRPLTQVHQLVHKHILKRLAGAGQIDCHALIRRFFYDRLREQPALKRETHRGIGEYYEDFREDYLEAAYHYREAGKYADVVRVLDPRRDQLIGAGTARRLLDVLDPIRPRWVRPADWAAIAAMKGQAHAFLGNFDKALTTYEQAIAAFEHLDMTDEKRRQSADLARQVGRLLGWRGEYAKAHARMEQGLRILGQPACDADRATAGLIHTHTGSLYFLEGQYDRAEAACRQALAILSGSSFVLRGSSDPRCWPGSDDPGRTNLDPLNPEDSRQGAVHAETYKVLGVIYDVTGRWDQAVHYARRSLAIWERLDNRHRMAELRDNLATLHFYRGDFAEAQKLYEQNLAFWDDVGARDKAGYARLNVGSVHLNRGEWDTAQAYYTQALLTWQQTENRKLTALAYNNLGFLEVVRGDYEKARSYLQRSVKWDPNAENYRGLSEAELGLGQLDQALRHAEQSLALARESGMPFEEGVTLRTIGRAYQALGDSDQSRRHLEDSLSILRGLGARYEAALTLRDLARVMGALGEESVSQARLAEAIATFGEVATSDDED